MTEQTLSSRLPRLVNQTTALRRGLAALLIFSLLVPFLLYPQFTQARDSAAERDTHGHDPGATTAARRPGAANSHAALAELFNARSDNTPVPDRWLNAAAQNTAAAGTTNYGGVIYSYGGLGAGFVMINPDGTNAINLTDAGFSNSSVSYPSASRQTGMIAFQGINLPGFPDSQGHPRIFVMNGDGTGVRQLTTFANPDPNSAGNWADDTKPSISPDGTMVAFISTRKRGLPIHQCNAGGTLQELNEVFVVNTDGTGLQQVTNPDFVDTSQPGGGGTCDTSDNYTVAWGAGGGLVIYGARKYTYSDGRGDRVVPAIDAGGGGKLFLVSDPGQQSVPTLDAGVSVPFLDVSPNNTILFSASVTNAFFSQFENTNSIGTWTPGALHPDVSLTQDLMGQVGYNGSTDGKPHGGRIDDARYSPDGSQILINGYSPRANLPVTFNFGQPALFLKNGDGMIPNTQGANSNNGLAWAPGPAIPAPASLTLMPDPLDLYGGEVVQEVPTLLDALGNPIVRTAVWHTGNTGFRCNDPGEPPCSGAPLQSGDIDFSGKVTAPPAASGRPDGFGALCAANGTLRTCIAYNYSNSLPYLSVDATQATASVHNSTPGVFTITRVVNTSQAATFSFSTGGTAVRDSDYTLNVTGNTISMSPGQASVTVNVLPTGNSAGHGDKTVTFTINESQNNSYLVDGYRKSATVTVKDDGPPPAAISLSSITPAKGGDGGTVTVTAYGANIKPGATMKLARIGQPDIPGTGASVGAAGTSLTATFDLTGKAQGAWDAVVTNPDNTSATLPAAFTVEAARPAQVWVDLLGRYTMRSSFTQPLYITYGNSGNIDAPPTLLRLYLPQGLTVTSMPRLPDGTLPNVVVDDTGQRIEFYVSGISANSSTSFPIQLTSSPQLAHQTVTLRVSALSTSDLASAASLQPDPSVTRTADVSQNTANSLNMVVHVNSASGGGDITYQITREDASGPGEPTMQVTETADEIQYQFAVYVQNPSQSPAASGTKSLLLRTSNLSFPKGAWSVVKGLFKFGKKSKEAYDNGKKANDVVQAAKTGITRKDLIDCLAGKGIIPGVEALTLKNFADGQVIAKIAENAPGLAQEIGAGFQIIGTALDSAFTSAFRRALQASIYSGDLNDDILRGELESYNQVSLGSQRAKLDEQILRRAIELCLSCPTKSQAVGSMLAEGIQTAADTCTPPPQNPDRQITLLIVSSSDPNEKDGPQGAGEAHFVNGATPLNYVISFENQSSATAPAQTVVVTDQLDASKLDLSTFSLGAFGFGGTALSAPAGLSSYSTDVDLRPSNNLIVHVSAQLDKNSGLLTWTFTSVDPATGKPTTDPTAGFLPPDKNPPEGQGSVTFSVMPKAGLANGTQVANSARIVFDKNTPIDTNQYVNTIDKSPPASHVGNLASSQPSVVFPVSWSGADASSGVASYDIYVSTNGGPYSLWQPATTATSALFVGQPATTYSFYSAAHDAAGNVESSKTTAEATTATRSDITNAVDDTRFYVRQHYLDFLSREPDSSGWDFWTNEVESCGADAQCREVKRINVSAAFFLSIEFQQTGYLVYRMYKAAFGNLQDKPVPVTRLDFLSDTREIASTPGQVIVGQGDWQTQLETNKQAFALAFVQRPQFTRAYPTTLTPAQFVDALFQNAGVTPSAAERQTAVAEFGTATDTADVSARARALRDVAENSAFTKAEFNRAFVLMEYFGYLQRDPDAAPDNNFSGYNFWLSKLDQFNGNYVQA